MSSDRVPGNEWVSRAVCAGAPLSVFYPSSGAPKLQHYDQAAALCAKCPVKAECLTDALMSGDDLGYRGGLTPTARVKLRQQLGIRKPGKPAGRCGDRNGARRHRKAGEPVCDACRDAEARWQNPEQRPMGGESTSKWTYWA